jgi:hypothetical protein
MDEQFVDQEQEHWDFEAGVATEFQNAFAISKMTTTIVREDERIAQLASEGLFVAVFEHEVACRYTDALLGYSRRVVGTGRTRAEALALLGCEEYYEAYVVDPAAKVVVQ